MDHRLELERRGRDPEQVLELTLDNCRVNGTGDAISPKLGEYVNLEKLRMINIGLTSLKGFPHLPFLKRLDISDNHLSGTLNYLAEACPNLEHLNMGGNHIKDLEVLTPLKNLAKLRHIDLYNCEVSEREDYRDKVWEMLPQLSDLDSFDRSNREVDDSDEDDDDDLSPSEDGENDSDEENQGGPDFDQQEYENGFGTSESEEEENDENDESGLLNIQLDENGIGIPLVNDVVQASESNDAEEYEDPDEGTDEEEAENEISFGQSPVPENHPHGVKRPHSDDEDDEDDGENAEDVEPDDLGPGENSDSQ